MLHEWPYPTGCFAIDWRYGYGPVKFSTEDSGAKGKKQLWRADQLLRLFHH